MDKFDNIASIGYYNSAKEFKWVNALDTLYYAWTKTDLGDKYFRLDLDASAVMNALGGVTRYLAFYFPGTVDGLIITVGEPIE
jgi:hypothetical protein